VRKRIRSEEKRKRKCIDPVLKENDSLISQEELSPDHRE